MLSHNSQGEFNEWTYVCGETEDGTSLEGRRRKSQRVATYRWGDVIVAVEDMPKHMMLRSRVSECSLLYPTSPRCWIVKEVMTGKGGRNGKMLDRCVMSIS